MTSVGQKGSVERQALETKALRAMFDAFTAKSLSYAVLRNYQHLPESIGARDIDILVAPADLGTAVEIICDLACDLNLKFANFYRDERLVQFALARRLDKGMLFDLKVDLFTNSQVYGVEAISASVMLEDSRTYNGISIVADDVLLLDKWLFHLIVGRPVHTKYDTEFARIGTCMGQRLVGVLGPLVGKSKAVALIAEVVAGRTSAITTFSRRERCVLLARLWKRQGISAIPRTLTFLAQRFRKRIRPHGIFLSVSGPDGSGKTTVIDHVITELGQVYGRGNVVRRHFRPTVLPRIAEVAKTAHAVETVDTDYEQPHRACPSGPVGSLFRLGYYWLDYVGGYLRLVHPALVDRRVVLFDRYYYDMISDPGRSRIALPMGLLCFAARLLPLPRFGFFVRVSPEEVFRRKQELSLIRIKELNDRYGDLVKNGMLIAVDNDGELPEEAAAQIVDTIIVQRDSRARQELGGLCR